MQYKSLKESTLRGYSKKDEYGRVYKTHDVYSHSGGAPNSRILTWIIDGVVYKAPRGVSFIWTQETLDRRRAEHRAKYGTELVEINKKGAPMVKIYLEEKKGAPLRTVWTDIYPLASNSNERVGYPTQKPEALLERIILASSNPGDLVADFFMGSGTTGVAALKLGRRFVGCDVNPEAVRLARERLGGG
jgi:methylase of polypeptide subunit release factors